MGNKDKRRKEEVRKMAQISKMATKERKKRTE
jgi:hypothetical protein